MEDGDARPLLYLVGLLFWNEAVEERVDAYSRGDGTDQRALYLEPG